MRFNKYILFQKIDFSGSGENKKYSGEGWWIVLSVIDVGKISCTG
jgi:hypothetical protein